MRAVIHRIWVLILVQAGAGSGMISRSGAVASATSCCHLDGTRLLKSRRRLAVRALILDPSERIHVRARLRRASLASRATFPPSSALLPTGEEALKAQVYDKLRRVRAKREAAMGWPRWRAGAKEGLGTNQQKSSDLVVGALLRSCLHVSRQRHLPLGAARRSDLNAQPNTVTWKSLAKATGMQAGMFLALSPRRCAPDG